MGTNYYLMDKESGSEILHIGKSSGGWCFALHVYEESDKTIHAAIQDYKENLKKIKDEISNISLHQMFSFGRDYKKELSNLNSEKNGLERKISIYQSLVFSNSENHGPRSLNEWKQIFNNPAFCIRDEYGNLISKDEMITIIENRSWNRSDNVPYPYPSWDKFLLANHAELGPARSCSHATRVRCGATRRVVPSVREARLGTMFLLETVVLSFLW